MITQNVISRKNDMQISRMIRILQDILRNSSFRASRGKKKSFGSNSSDLVQEN